MAVRKIDCTVPDSRKNITMRHDPTRIDPVKLKLGKQVARHERRGQPGSWGGHAVPVVAYDVRGITWVTWGALQPMVVLGSLLRGGVRRCER